MKKKIGILLCAVLLLSGCGKTVKLSNGDEAVVSFTKDGLSSNQLNISANELYDELKSNYAIGVLVDMIDKKIYDVEYADKKDEAKQYAADQLATYKKYFTDDSGNYDEDSLLSYLSQNYSIYSIADFTTSLETNYYVNLAAEDYAKTLVTDKEIKDYYKSDIVGDIKVRHILITPDVTDDMTSSEQTVATTAAYNKAKDIITTLDKSKDVTSTFIELAKKYSDDTNNASTGGELDYFNKGAMQSSFETAAYALKDGAYTEAPVKTTYGYHIILRISEKAKKSLSEVKNDIISSLAEEKMTTDKTIQVNGLVALRKKYGVKFEDSELNSQYEKLIQYQISQAKASDTES